MLSSDLQPDEIKIPMLARSEETIFGQRNRKSGQTNSSPDQSRNLRTINLILILLGLLSILFIVSCPSFYHSNIDKVVREFYAATSIKTHPYNANFLYLSPLSLQPDLSMRGHFLPLQITEVVVMTEMDQLGTESLAGPTLGLLISLYAVTTGSTFFLLQGSSSSRNFFRAINIFYGGSMFLTMLLVSTQLLTVNS